MAFKKNIILFKNIMNYLQLIDDNILSSIFRNLKGSEIKNLMNSGLVYDDKENLFRYLMSLDFPNSYKLLRPVRKDIRRQHAWKNAYIVFKNETGDIDSESYEMFALTPLGDFGKRAYIYNKYPGIYNRINYLLPIFDQFRHDTAFLLKRSSIYRYLVTGKLDVILTPSNIKNYIIFMEKSACFGPYFVPDFPIYIFTLILTDNTVDFGTYENFLNIISEITNVIKSKDLNILFDDLGTDKLLEILEFTKGKPNYLKLNQTIQIYLYY